jgi:hypothetical protein
MRSWLFTGIAQALGTLLGLLLGVLLFMAVMLVVRGRTNALKFEPIIRVEIPGSAQSVYPEVAVEDAKTGEPSQSKTAEASTPVADFCEEGLAFGGDVLSYEEQRQAKLAQQEQQQQEILKQVFEDNVALQMELGAA